ncbi:hypothetical protein AAC387_Pa08g0732 [Persea americana]
MLFGNGKVLRLYSDTHAALPPLSYAVKSHFPSFLHCERRKTGCCGFNAAVFGGKLDFPAFLHSERRKAGNSCLTATPLSGKVDFLVFLHSERRKTGNCIYVAGACSGNLSIRFFILFSLILLVGGSWVGA